MQNNKSIKLYTIIFIVVELILGLLVQLTSGNLNTIVSFAAVVLACCYPLLFMKKEYGYIFTQVGLIATVFADLFLVVIEPMYQIPAMCFFSITQICYCLRILLHQNDKQKKLHLLIRGISVIVVLLITVIVLKDKTDFLSLISMFYYTNLIINIVFAFTQMNKSLLLPIGLVLFACCDALIGLDILNSAYMDLSNNKLLYFLCNPGFNLAWVFYVPSQLLIALSVNEK